MNVLSLFDGMSCGRIALERAGITPTKYFASEVDKYAIQVTQRNYPNTIQLGDVKNVKGIDSPPIDLLIGGSPCQGFSFAGKHLNFDDERSKLFFEFVRLLQEVKPKYFLMENVKMEKESQDIISEFLGVEPVEINSLLVSAQQRKRLYWTNIPFGNLPEDRGLLFQDIVETGETRKEKAWALTSTYYKKGGEPTRQRNFIKCQRPIVWISQDETRWLTPIECERLQTVPDGYTEGVSNTQRYKMLGNGWTVDVVAHIFKGLQEEYGHLKRILQEGKPMVSPEVR